MHDWSDNELDGMSREAADNYGPDKGMPNWDALQKQLDKELPERKEDNRKRFFFLIFLCLLLTAVTGYLLISQYNGSTNQNNQIISSDNLKPTSGQNNDSKAEESKTITGSGKQESEKNLSVQPLNNPGITPAPSSIGNKKTTKTFSWSSPQQINATNPSAVNGKNSGKKKLTQKNTGKEDLVIFAEPDAVNRNKVSESKAVPQKNESALGTAVAISEADKANAISPGATDAPKPETEKTITDQTATAKDTIATDATVIKSTTVKAASKSSGIELSLLAGIDASSVKFKYGDEVGMNLGVLIGYRFNKKWSVGTGLIYTKKNYTAAGSDFNPPKNYWTNGIKLEKVDGSCYMWEVPVYATYRFKTTRKSGWFASMGFSSYFMTKEDYTYHYKYNNGNPATRHWENTDPSNYWFSVLGISGGWEKNIGNGLSLGIAPYAKLPIQGVGFGDMSLSSYGLNLLLNYRKAPKHK